MTRSPRSRDGGVDLYAHRINAAGDERIVVRCQHAYGSVVVLAVARAPYTVLGAEQHLTKGVLVTNGCFSPWCRSYAEGKRIDLIDRKRLNELLVRYQVR